MKESSQKDSGEPEQGLRATEQQVGAKSNTHPLLLLNRAAGNQVVARLLQGDVDRPSLRISQPADPEEIEADRVAEQITRSSDPGDSQPIAVGVTSPPSLPQETPISKDADGENRGSSPGVVPPFGGGAPLDESARRFFEHRFQRDLSHVRVHTDGNATRLARSFNAHAFATGSDITFGEGQYQPNTGSGRKLIAHELAHVVASSRFGAMRVSRERLDSSAAPDAIPARSSSAAYSPGIVTGADSMVIHRSPSPEPDDDYDDDEDLTEELDPLDQLLLNAQETYERQSENPKLPADERALARRIYLLLSQGPEKDFADEKDVRKFIDWCIKTGAREDPTLNNLNGDRNAILLDEGAAFPYSWADKIESELHKPADTNRLLADAEARRKEALDAATAIGDEIWQSGLPLTLAEASTFTVGDIPRLALNAKRARDGSDDLLSGYVRRLIRWELASTHYWLVFGHEKQFTGRVASIRRGDVVIDESEYQGLRGGEKVFRVKLNAFDEAVSNPLDMNKALSALLLQEPGKFDRLQFTDWPVEGVRALWKEIAEVDRNIAGTGKIMSIARAFMWAHSRGFFKQAGEEVWDAIKDNAAKMIATLVGIIVLNMIPGVNVAVDLILLIKFGMDAIDTVVGLASALKHAGGANTVVELEHASAELARTLIGTGAEIAMWAATWGTVKAIKEVAKWKRAESFLDKHGRNAETREALIKAKGDAAEAEKIIARKREYERQEREIQAAEQRRKAAEQERTRQRDEEAKQKQAAEAKRKQEEEAKHKREEDAKRKQEEEAKRKREEDAKRKQEEEAKRKREEDAKRKQEEETKRRQEEEAKRKTDPSKGGKPAEPKDMDAVAEKSIREKTWDETQKKLKEIGQKKKKADTKIDNLSKAIRELNEKLKRLKEELEKATGAEKDRISREIKKTEDTLNENKGGGLRAELEGTKREKWELEKRERSLNEALKLTRPALRASTKRTIIANAPRESPNGRFLDAKGRPIDGPTNFGHIYGKEHRRLALEAQQKGMNQAQFNDWVNNHPEWFQIESAAENLSHVNEKRGLD